MAKVKYYADDLKQVFVEQTDDESADNTAYRGNYLSVVVTGICGITF